MRGMHTHGDGDGAQWCACYTQVEWVVGALLCFGVLFGVAFVAFVVGCLLMRHFEKQLHGITLNMRTAAPPPVQQPYYRR
jgi:hypothetical protein